LQVTKRGMSHMLWVPLASPNVLDVFRGRGHYGRPSGRNEALN